MSIGFDYGSVAVNRTDISESPHIWLDGVNLTASIQVEGTGTLASPTMELYENGTDVSGSKLTGSMTVSGRVINLKTMTSLLGGVSYKWYAHFTDDGIATTREGVVLVMKYGVNPSRYPSAVNKYRVYGSPILVYPNFSAAFNIIVDGQGALASATTALYKGTATQAALLSSTESISQRTITTKVISGMTSGEYLAYLTFTDNGATTWRYFELLVPKMGV